MVGFFGIGCALNAMWAVAITRSAARVACPGPPLLEAEGEGESEGEGRKNENKAESKADGKGEGALPSV